MCGIAGIWFRQQAPSENHLSQVASRMVHALRHRGPDGHGIWKSPKDGLALVHTRLSIIDLSTAAQQPMKSTSGRYQLVYNGEIYNASDLRKDLERQGFAFQTSHSDTEALLMGIEAWGLEATVEKAQGMFAFALWDQREEKLFLVRDRFGVKPLFWGIGEDSQVFFTSELKAVRAIAPLTIDPESLGLYFQFGYVPAPHSIYKNVFKLEPGVILSVSRNGDPQKHVYWSAQVHAQTGISKRSESMDVEHTQRELWNLLRQSVQKRMISDVPIGCFLSGGIDSSLVASLMQEASPKPIQTFTIGFEDKAYNEAPFAKEIASHLGTNHTESYISETEAIALIPELPRIYDEPFADSSAIPTTLVSKLARQSVTVALSGDGGDELFGGYRRYFYAQKIWPLLNTLPFAVRRVLARSLNTLSPSFWDAINRNVPFIPSTLQLSSKVPKFSRMLMNKKFEDVYLRFLRTTDRKEFATDFAFSGKSLSEASNLDQMMLWDTLMYLPDDILTKVDRASMAWGLEAREPLLDHTVYEYAWTLPKILKQRGRSGKWILKEILKNYVPESMFDRPKVGFGIPLAEWLRGKLKDWGSDLIYSEDAQQDSYLNTHTCQEIWENHQSGVSNEAPLLWTLLMYLDWKKSLTEVTPYDA